MEPSTDDPSVLLPLGASTWHPGGADLPGVVHATPSPPSTVLLIGDVDPDQVGGALRRAGCTTESVEPWAAVATAATAGAVRLALIAAEVMAHGEGERLVGDLRSVVPGLSVILLAPTDQLDPALLVRALRVGVADVVDPADVITLSSCVERFLLESQSAAERVLAVGAHPDDVEIGCAGALLDHRRRGDDIVILTLSRGAVGGNQQARMVEAEAAAARIGARLLLGDLPDTRIDPGIDTIRLIEAVVRTVDPTVVYVHSRHDNHQDHRAVNTAVLSAVRQVPRVYAYQSPSSSNDFFPTRYVPVDAVIAQKVEVLALFESQGERAYMEPEAVVASARYWARGLAPRARYAEPFEVIRSFTPARSEGSGHGSAGAAASVSPLPAGVLR
ncbi:PIG-L deacetylase family protein [Serinicoccus kebangsaanensis]|uniref:PIG-L deacetylase family protein n=1 Tax=Serinicoccus kebangsaanensis TaxID=2602069 RepID=UPI00124D8473|nr:PIG-L deacetylase family protein [Serinicoccus kebangsaanensis]